jgi:hypothetical protein
MTIAIEGLFLGWHTCSNIHMILDDLFDLQKVLSELSKTIQLYYVISHMQQSYTIAACDPLHNHTRRKFLLILIRAA